ncbi:MAG: hypothetical protein N3A71_00930 [Candidatus Dojkabacteria bacterium]|nr:hypothetical protein [Candidatus Dojkabacteria bacterium]
MPNQSSSQDYQLDPDILAGVIDTSRTPNNLNQTTNIVIYHIICKDCGYVYEGSTKHTKCPRCGSQNLDDNQTILPM